MRQLGLRREAIVLFDFGRCSIWSDLQGLVVVLSGVSVDSSTMKRKLLWSNSWDDERRGAKEEWHSSSLNWGIIGKISDEMRELLRELYTCCIKPGMPVTA